MAEDNSLGLAVVRNRLLAGKVDARDYELLTTVQRSLPARKSASPYSAVLQWAIGNALSDIKAGALDRAARELDLVHNLPLALEWSEREEEYFLKGAVATYIENASVDRIKGLFSNFADEATSTLENR